MNNEVEALKNIKRQETPPFLFTRIEQRIKNLENDYISFQGVLRFGAVAMLIAIINIVAINQNLNAENKYSKQETTQEKNLVEALEMNTSNQLYYE